MSEPADKSDDLIAELAKLMATPPGGGKPVPAVNNGAAPAAQKPVPGIAAIRIPGMDQPKSASAAAPAPQPDAPRAPMTGSIRIPGMDQPAPVSTSAPVGKFDFGAKPSAATPIRQEPLSSLAERLAPRTAEASRPPQPAPAADSPPATPVRIPSALTPVSENRSFAEGPALVVARPVGPPAAALGQGPPAGPKAAPSNFNFDFGFNQSPQPAAPETKAAAAADPIAALIEADMADAAPDIDPADALEPEPQRAPEPVRPAMSQVTPIQRAPGGQQAARPALSAVAPAPQARTGSNAPIPLKPVSVTPRSPEADRFAISPGVGLNMRPPAGASLGTPTARAPDRPAVPVDDSDPMSEIENLIGEAVRVELSPGPVRVQTPQMVSPKVQLEPEADLEAEIHQDRRPEPAPVVPPLTTQFAPRRTNMKDDVGNASAEDAILAAAAASGAQVGRVEPTVGDESPYRRLKVKPQRNPGMSSGVRQYVGMAVAGTLLLAAGLGLYWVLNMGRPNTTGANAPVLTADATPVKVKPTDTAKPATDATKSPVLAKMNGTSSSPSSEQLVSTDETAGGDVTRDVTPVTDNSGENGLANRKVRTVTVRPDGTIVPGDDAVAGGEELPVDRPNVPSVPSVPSSAPTDLLGSNSTQVAANDATTSVALTGGTDAPATTGALPPATAADATTQVAEVKPTIDPTAVAPTPMTFPVRGGNSALALNSTPKAPTNTSVNAVVTGAQTPNGQINLLGNGSGPKTTTQTQQVASAQTPATAPPASTAPATTAGAYVQLSSQPTAADAAASAKSMQAKYGSLFGGNKLTVQSADLGAKGVRYRVRLPVGTLSDANSICAQIKAQGGDCFATNG